MKYAVAGFFKTFGFLAFGAGRQRALDEAEEEEGAARIRRWVLRDEEEAEDEAAGRYGPPAMNLPGGRPPEIGWKALNGIEWGGGCI